MPIDTTEKEAKPRKSKSAFYSRLAIYSIITTLMSVVLLALSLYLVFERDKKKTEIAGLQASIASLQDEKDAAVKENEYLLERNKSLQETSTGARFRAKLKEMAQGGDSTIQMLKYFFPDELVLTDEGSFHFFPIDTSLKLNGRDPDNYILNEAGEIEYREDGATTSMKGIDVSRYNGEIDWEAVAASGVRFAYIRCGIRGYESGKLVKDDTFDQNVRAALDAGLEVGTYFFTQAASEAEAVEEAEFVLDCIKGLSITCPIAYDLEKIDGADSKPRLELQTQEEITNNTIAFMERLKADGYTPIIYGNIKTYLLMLDMTRLEEYQKWFAGYISKDVITPYFPYEFRIWQYRSDGSCPGVSSDCDMNIAFW